MADSIPASDNADSIFAKIHTCLKDSSPGAQDDSFISHILADFQDLEPCISAEGDVVIQDIFLLMLENLNELKSRSISFNQIQYKLFGSWLNNMQHLLKEEDKAQYYRSLIDNLSCTDWPVSLSKEEAGSLYELLDTASSAVDNGNTREETDIIADENRQAAVPVAEMEDDTSADDVVPDNGSDDDRFEGNGSSDVVTDKGLNTLAAMLELLNSHQSIAAADMLAQFEQLSDYFFGHEQAVLNDLCIVLSANLEGIQAEDQRLSQQQQQLLVTFCEHLKQYIQGKDQDNNIVRLVNIAARDDWPEPLPGEDVEALLEMSGLKEDGIAQQDQADDLSPPSEESLPTGEALTLDEGDSEPLEKVVLSSEGEAVLPTGEAPILDEGDSEPLEKVVLSSEGEAEAPGEALTLDGDDSEPLEAAISSLEEEVESIEEVLALDEGNSELLEVPVSAKDTPSIKENKLAAYEDVSDGVEKAKSQSVFVALEDLEVLLEQYALDQSVPDLGKLISHIQDLSQELMKQGDPGIIDTVALIEENLICMRKQQHKLRSQHISLLQQWRENTYLYMTDADNQATVTALIDIVKNEIWPLPLQQDDVAIMLELFGFGEVSIDGDDSPDDFVAPESDYDDELAVGDETGDFSDVKAQPQLVSSDLVNMLVAEMQQMKDELEATLSSVRGEDGEDSDLSESMMKYAEHIERFGNACQAADMPGLFHVSVLMKKNLVGMLGDDKKLTNEQKALLAEWPKQVLAYLENLGDKTKSQKIAKILLDDTLIEPLLSEISPALIDLLNAPYIDESQEIAEPEHIKKVRPEDVSIDLPEDINSELLEGLLIEMPQQIEGLVNATQALSDGSGSMADMEKAQRIVHTIKGSANTVGIKGVANLAHSYEDILVILNQYKKFPPAVMIETMMDAVDCLQDMYEALQERRSAPANAEQVLQAIVDWVNLIKTEGEAVLQGDALVEKSDPKSDKPGQEEKAEATIRVSTHLIDEILRLLGETIIHTSQLQDRIERTGMSNDALLQQNKLIRQLVGELEQQVELRGEAFSGRNAVNHDHHFDPLEFEQYNELNTITNRLNESTNDIHVLNHDLQVNVAGLNELLVEQTRTHQHLQELVMRSRMVPVKTVQPRLQRCVRQACRQVGKQAELKLSGRETLVDRDVLDMIIAPLMHILRNAIDHGIEDAETRLQKGKNQQGNITMDFTLDSGNIRIVCKDDGQGIDYQSIRRTAINNGLIEEAQEVSDKELNALLMQAGFTTKHNVTHVSGRGVGMDVVRSQITAMKGTINIQSQQDKGCVIDLRLPASLLSTHGILVRQNDSVYAISNRGVERIVSIRADDITVEGDDKILCTVEGKRYEASTLQHLLNLAERGDKTLYDYSFGLIIKDAEIEHVVLYDQFVQITDLFIKNMGQYLQNIKGVMGATILGDGSVAAVLDLPMLIRIFQSQEMYIPPAHTLQKTKLPVALVVDDSLSARQALVNVVSDAGYDVIAAQDGLDAIEMIGKKRPDILLVDMEMPRMNGVELATHIRSNENTREIPVIMVTSRTTDKHKELAMSIGIDTYLYKPFHEDELIDHISRLLSKE